MSSPSQELKEFDRLQFHRAARWRVLGICLAAFVVSAGVRLIEITRWDPVRTQVAGEYLLATHDAYFWVAGAEGINPRSASHVMSGLLRLLALIPGASPANVAFWAPAFLGGLIAIAITLWAVTLGAPHSAILAALFGSLAPAVFTRTRLGYYDTDWATLFFPLLTSWILANWLAPYLRKPDELPQDPILLRHDLLWIAFLLFLIPLGIAWHPFIGIYAVGLLWIGAILVLLLGRTGMRDPAFQGLFILSLAVGFGWVGVMMGLLLLWLRQRYAERVRLDRAHWITISLLLIGLSVITIQHFGEYLPVSGARYAGIELESEGATSGGDLIYPDPGASVRETQIMDLHQVLEGVGFHAALAALGMMGSLVVLVRRPIFSLLVPMLILGLGAIAFGARFAMYAAPVVSLGLLVPLDWMLTNVWTRNGWPEWVEWVVLVLPVIIILPAVTLLYSSLPTETVVRPAHAEALIELGEVADPEGTVWTWWDYGYAAQHFAGMETFADGGWNSGEHLFTLGKVLGSSDSAGSSALMQYAARHDLEPWREWDLWTEDALVKWFVSLGTDEIRPEAPAPQYLVVQWEALPLLPWIQTYSSWDLLEGKGQHGDGLLVDRPKKLDLSTGVFESLEGSTVFARTVDVLAPAGLVHYEYPSNSTGPHLLLNTTVDEVMLLDAAGYQSTMVRLLIQPTEGTEAVPSFSLVVDRFPNARVYRAE